MRPTTSGYLTSKKLVSLALLYKEFSLSLLSLRSLNIQAIFTASLVLCLLTSNNIVTPNYHPVASSPMLPQHLGGVLDPSLKLYGTSNVRVIDASAFPTQIDGHLTSTIYAFAEKAADGVRASLTRCR